MAHSNNTDKGTATKMKVAVRLRPALKKAEEETKLCVRGLDDTSLEIWNWRDYRQTIKYNFDVFIDAALTQRDVYNRCVKTLITKTLHGQNTSIFAYGPTGAGKTYTMLGTTEHPGIIPRAVNQIFSEIDRLRKDASDSQWSYTLSFSYLEIYQEKVYDLLEVKTQDLPIRENRDRMIFIPNLAEKTIDSLQQFNELFVPASKNRTTAATKLNSRSSRSHSILLLKVVKQQNIPPYKKQVGKAYLIDLAGSENNKKTGNQGIRLKESGAINTSLFVLGQVVDALNQGLARIPYRDSKLTRLLQDSLGGSAHACMITNIAPEQASYMETYTALNFASKSRQIVNRPFTRETIEKPVFKLPSKRQNSNDGSEPSRSSPPKKARKDSNCNKAADDCAKPQESALFLSPLLKRQANFEESMKLRLQALENNILTQLNPSTNQRRQKKSYDQPNLEILEQLKQNAHQLAELRKRSRNFQQALSSNSTEDQPNTSQEMTRDVEKNSSRHLTTVPRAVVQPMQVLTQSNGAPATILNKHPKPDVRYMKIKATSDCGESKENTCRLQPNPELQAKHTAEIIQLLNTGTVKQLKSLQSIGEKRAQLIHSWRQMFGDFTKIDDLRKVNGLPSKTVDAIIRNNLLCHDTAQA